MVNRVRLVYFKPVVLSLGCRCNRLLCYAGCSISQGRQRPGAGIWVCSFSSIRYEVEVGLLEQYMIKSLVNGRASVMCRLFEGNRMMKMRCSPDRVDVEGNLYLFDPKTFCVFDLRAVSVYGIPHPHVGLRHNQQAIAFVPWTPCSHQFGPD